MIMKESGNMLDKRACNATFVIQVQYSQNSTWQGKILWVESKKTEYFRSGLEMLMLMESALKGEQAKTKKRNIF